MPTQEICAYHTDYTTTHDAVPRPLCDESATLGPGEAVWIHVRVKASNNTKSWYCEVLFFARRLGAAAPIIYSKMPVSYEPEGKVPWKIEMVNVSTDSVVIRVIGQAGTVVDWAVSSRGFKKFPL